MRAKEVLRLMDPEEKKYKSPRKLFILTKGERETQTELDIFFYWPWNDHRVYGEIESLKSTLPKFPNLALLSFALNDIADKGATELANSLNILPQKLTGFIISYNEIGDTGVNALMTVLKSHEIQYLCLQSNKIGAQGAKSIAEALNPNLNHLNLSWNNIGDEGAKALAKALEKCPNLIYLSLNCNNIGDEGTKALAKALLKCPNLKELFLGENNIGDEGAQALALVLEKNPKLEIALHFNNIGDAGLASLKKASPTIKDICFLGNKKPSNSNAELPESEELELPEPEELEPPEPEESEPPKKKLKYSNEEYEMIPNPGAGDCGVYAVIHAMEGENADIGIGRIKIIRDEIVKVMSNFIALTTYRSPDIYGAVNISVKGAILNEAIKIYKKIFKDSEDGFNNFKFIVSNHIESCLNSVGLNQDTKEKISLYKGILDQCSSWMDLVSNINLVGYIFCKFPCFGLNIDSVFHDHRLPPERYLNDYINHSSTAGVHLNNSELYAYLISKGYIQGEPISFDNGTIITFTNNSKEKLALYANATDRFSDAVDTTVISDGTHWEGVEISGATEGAL